MIQGIREFFQDHQVDKDFDDKFYAKQYPHLEEYHQPFCKEHNIDDRHRLFFHWYYHGEVEETCKNIEEWNLSGKNYKPAKQDTDKQVSVVLGCKNRNDMLDISVHSWIKHEQIKEIIITDWSSDKSIEHLESISPKIKVIRVEGKEYYNASTPVNIAIKEAKYPIILKLDVDYIINPYCNFNDLIDIAENEYICGDWRDKYIDNDLGFVQGTNGFLCVYKKHIETVGYYDESIENYGVEDCDMFFRLLQIGLKRKTLKFGKGNTPIYHNPHSDYYRTENFPIKNIGYNHKHYGSVVLPNTYKGPDFIIAGFQKCGTTALRNILIENYPDRIHMPDCLDEECEGETEINFFQKNSRTKNLDIEWYKSLFDPFKVSGEKSPNYMLNSDYSARRIKRYLPKIKLIFLLRNPVDRAYSAYNHYKQIYPQSKNWNWRNDLSFIENFNAPNCGFRTLGLYSHKIYNYLKYFDFRQMCFVIQERLKNQEKFQDEFEKIRRFLNLPKQEKYKYLQSHNRKYEEPLCEQDRSVLHEFYKPYNEKLFQLINYRVPEWESLKNQT